MRSCDCKYKERKELAGKNTKVSNPSVLNSSLVRPSSSSYVKPKNKIRKVDQLLNMNLRLQKNILEETATKKI